MADKLNSWEVWNLFFNNDEFRKSKFEPNQTYVGPSLNLGDSGQIYYNSNGRILKNTEHFKYCFDLHLRSLGYSVDSTEEFGGPHSNINWVRYVNRNPENRTLVVNYEGMKIPKYSEGDGPWADISIRDWKNDKSSFKNSLADALKGLQAA
ncbi:hypothetical protein J4461_00570 [Candidatus Pacearchaeota archaeon]|nr:hypothetical protein [Candidatus Pacearchaeota archaeon]